MVKIIKEKKNVLDIETKDYMAHFVCGDLQFEEEVGKQINKVHKMANRIVDEYDIDIPVIGKTLCINNIFNVFYRKSHNEKVKIDDSMNALKDLRKQCEEKGIKRLYFAKYEDEKVSWATLELFILDVFYTADDMEIVICE
jgi:hypothetical protein